MKYYALLLLAGSAAFAQQSTTYQYDVNGRPVSVVSLTADEKPGSVERRQTVRNANGRTVPVDEVEEKVISDDGATRIVERTVRRYDADGRPGPPEKSRIETRKQTDGGQIVATTTWRGDINGRLQLAERSTSEARKSGSTTSTTTLVERPSLNGAFEPFEKREELRSEAANGGFTQSTTVLRPDTNGRLAEAARQTVERTLADGTTIENSALYQTGELVRQTVSRTVKEGEDEHAVVDVFEAQAAGRARAAGESTPQLRERQIIERTRTANGLAESVSVQRPLPSDPKRLSGPQLVERTICTGKCS